MRTIATTIVCALALVLVTFTPAGAAVSSSSQQCINGAIAAGSSAVKSPARLKALFTKYFDVDYMVKRVLGSKWRTADKQLKEIQGSLIRDLVVDDFVPRIAKYNNPKITFIREWTEGGVRKVSGTVKANGETMSITWEMNPKICKFYNLSVTGKGSLLSMVRKKVARNN